VNGFSNPLGLIDDAFETRPDDSIITGGTVLAGQFFRGDAASMMNGPRWPNIRPMPMTVKQRLSGLTANHRLILV
jgi:hypothetical protein